MNTLLADTSFLVAYLSPRNEHHALAVRDVLTADHHFRQAGFTVLLTWRCSCRSRSPAGCASTVWKNCLWLQWMRF
jgi:hypothetical protein